LRSRDGGCKPWPEPSCALVANGNAKTEANATPTINIDRANAVIDFRTRDFARKTIITD
jgi:hypothetical protein